jgi:hypothetical protein
MRYVGGGIGHHSTTTDSIWEDVEGVEDDLDVEMLEAANDDANHTQASLLDDIEHPNEEDYLRDNDVEQHVPEDDLELEDYDYAKAPGLENASDDEANSEGDDRDDLGPDGEDDEFNSDHDVEYHDFED